MLGGGYGGSGCEAPHASRVRKCQGLYIRLMHDGKQLCCRLLDRYWRSLGRH